MRVQKKTKRVLYWGITLVLMILIFSFSAKNGTSSAGMSIGYAKELARILSFFWILQDSFQCRSYDACGSSAYIR